jgi:hypothetical protein
MRRKLVQPCRHPCFPDGPAGAIPLISVNVFLCRAQYGGSLDAIALPKGGGSYMHLYASREHRRHLTGSAGLGPAPCLGWSCAEAAAYYPDLRLPRPTPGRGQSAKCDGER